MGEGERTVAARERAIGRDVAHFAPGEGSRSLWVFGELVMYKIKGEQTGGAYSLFEVVAQPREDRRPTSSTARTSPSTCSRASTSS
jgi:hypothetical protein